jgi:hypothetical protein
MGFPATCKAMMEAGYKRSTYSRCVACHTAMEWWLTPRGRPIPMDSMPSEDSPAVSHFATCPNADQFRKQPAKAKPTPSLFDEEPK